MVNEEEEDEEEEERDQLYHSTSTRSSTSARQHGMMCSICLSTFEEGEGVGRLPCQHVFHAACIKDWLGLKQTCPLCMRNVPAMYHEGSEVAGVAGGGG